MDKHLRPQRFDTEPNSNNAEKEWRHWYRTFINFLNEVHPTPAAAADGTPPTEAVLTALSTKRLNTLTVYIAPNVFDFIIDATTYETAIQTLEQLYVKPKSVIFNRHKLATSKQTPGESVDQFMQTLEKLSKNCEFTPVTAEVYRQEYTRDAFINGLCLNSIRQRLLENNNLTLSAAFQQARTLELAQKQSDSYTSSNLGAVAAVTQDTPVEPAQPEQLVQIPAETLAAMNINPDPSKCYHCGNKKHKGGRSKCPALNSICTYCKTKGHWEKVCQKAIKDMLAAKSVSAFGSAFGSAPGPALMAICNQSKPKRNIVYTKSIIKGKNVDTMMDSGSSFTFMGHKCAKRLNLFILPKSDSIPMADPNYKAQIIGEVVVDITINGRLYIGLVVSVLKSMITDLIVGTDFMEKHKEVTFKFGGSEAPLVIGAVDKPDVDVVTVKPDVNVVTVKPEVDAVPLSKMKVPPPPLFTNLTENCKPVADKSRRFNKQKTDFIDREIKKQLAEGTIEPSVSPWRSQVHVTTDEDQHHRQRMVIDYSNTINMFTELDAYPMPNINEHVEKISQYKVFSTFDLKSAFHQIPIREEDKPYTAFEANGKLYQSTVLPYGVKNGVPAFMRTIDKIVEDEGLTQTFPFVDNITICGVDQADHDAQKEKWLQACVKYNITLNHKKSIISTNSITVLGYIIENGCLRPDPERFRPLMELPAPTNLTSQKRILGMFAYYSKWVKNYSDKVRPLNKNTTFPLPSDALESFNAIKNDIKTASLATIDPDEPFLVETDASKFALAATLNQNGRPVAFFSRTLKPAEIGHHAVEKEACAIVESLQYWNHYLAGRHFKLITDQRSVSYMYDTKKRSKIKNDKIARWRIELSCLSFDISYRPGKENVGADTLSRVEPSCSATAHHTLNGLHKLHDDLCHPGITRLLHYVKSKNLPYTISDVKSVCEPCSTCMKEKPRFIRTQGVLIKATQPFQQLNIDFKGPLPASQSGNKYLLTLVDEYSRFPFAFPCRDMTSQTVIKCFDQLFSLFGMPGYIHNDRAPDFLSDEVTKYLHNKGIATSRTSRYNPKGNGQAERFNGTIWQTVRLALTSKRLPLSAWETVLPNALHSIRSLLCTATNVTPHERLFSFNRKSATGTSIPSWLTPGRVYLRNHTRSSKHEPIVEEAELLDVNPQYAHVKLRSGHETTVSLRDIAPCHREPSGDDNTNIDLSNTDHNPETEACTEDTEQQSNISPPVSPSSPTHPAVSNNDQDSSVDNTVRRSTRSRRERELFADSEHSSI